MMGALITSRRRRTGEVRRAMEATIERLERRLGTAYKRIHHYQALLADARGRLIAPGDADVDELVRAVGALVARTTAIENDPPRHDQGAHMVALDYGLWRGVVDAHDHLRLRKARA